MSATLAYLAGATGQPGGRFGKGGVRNPGRGFNLDEMPDEAGLAAHFAGTRYADTPSKQPTAWAYQRLGFDKSKPEVVGTPDEVRARRDIAIVVHRGNADSPGQPGSAFEFHDEFVHGDHWVGSGRFGDGTYTTPSMTEADAYGRMVRFPSTESGTGGLVTTIGIKSDARIVDYSPNAPESKAQQGLRAMTAGAQIMRIPPAGVVGGSESYYVVFDRSAIVVADKPNVTRAKKPLTAAPAGWSPLVDSSHPLIILDARHLGSFDALVAPWGSCILNGGEGRGKCVQPPVDGDGYRYAHVAGSQAIIPMGLPHADIRLPVSAAVQHYADTGYAAAVVTYREDEHGIWASGDLVPGLSERDRFVISKAALSGDWRWIEEEGRYRMIAAQVVNTPGFRSAYTAGRRQFAMAASANALVTSWEPLDWRGELLERLARSSVQVAPSATRAFLAAAQNPGESAVAAFLAGATGQPGGRFGLGGRRVPGRGKVSTTAPVFTRKNRPTLDDQTLATFAKGSAMAHLESDGKGGTRFTAERHALHERIIGDTLAQGRVSDSPPPSFTMLGGGAASGKSTVLKTTGLKVDPDAIKAELPEYNPKKGVAFTHEESSYIAKQIATRGLGERFDVTIDGVGGNVGSVASKVAEARSHGYRAEGVYVTTSVNDALGRNRARSRTVPQAVLRHGHAQVAGNFEKMVPLFDGISLTENMSGKSLVGIAHSEGGKLVIDDPAAWKSFMAKRPRKRPNP